MAPRRVLLRIKKLRRFLDERIRDATRRRDAAEDDGDRSRASARLEAYQDVREEMVGERADPDRLEPAPETEAEEELSAG